MSYDLRFLHSKACNALPFPGEHFIFFFFLYATNQPQMGHKRFAAHRELEFLPEASSPCDGSFDLGSRALYAADSSIYRQLPIGIVLPRGAATVEVAQGAFVMTVLLNQPAPDIVYKAF